MASILRSSKFVRYIAGFARNIVVNTPREFDGSLVNHSQCVCNAIPRSLATRATTKSDHNLDNSLRRIDQDVRRSGRISRRDVEDILEEIRSSQSATSSQSLLVIRCCGNLVPDELPEIRTKLVQEIWNTLKKLNVPMDISHYNALLRVYLENEHAFSPTEFLNELESKGLDPNRVTYQRLIARYCQIGDIEGATKILEFMREKQLPVNENVFNALIMGHSQTGDMDSALGILSVMTQAGLEPSADTYTTLLCGYAKKGDIAAVTNILSECENKEVYLLDKDIFDIIYALTINGHGQHVPFLLGKARKAFGYNQDAINVILRLINKGHEDTAVLILKTMLPSTKSDGTPQPSGAFLIKQLVKANRPVEKIIEICNILESENLHDRGVLLAAETSLQLANEDLSYALLKELQNRGTEVRQHFFWPLILSKTDDPTGKGIIEVLLQMNNFNITPSAETLREYVIPHMSGNSSEIIAKLRQANISVGSAACSLVHSLLLKNDIEEAAVIASRVNAYYHPGLIKRPLSNALYATKDVNSYVTILRHIYENADRQETVVSEVEGSQERGVLDKTDAVGPFILDLTVSRSFINIVEDVLKKIVEQGLSLSATCAEIIQDKLGEKLTPELSSLLGKLTSGELTPIPLEKKPPVYTPSNQMNIPQLERLIFNLENKNQDVKGLRRLLLTLYCRAKDLDKVKDLLNKLENEGFVYTTGAYAQLIEVFSYHDKLEEALMYYEKLKELDPGVSLDEVKIMRVAGIFIKNGRFDEGIAFLQEQERHRKPEERTFAYTGMCWRLLHYLAEKGDSEKLKILFDVMVKHEYIEVNNVILGPLIKVHIVNNDYDKAVEQFEWCCNQFRATPWKNELTCKLIEAEDAEKLQKLTDLSTSIHGEVNSLYDLVFAFVECGRIRQARKILETPGLQTRANRINTACQRYQQEGMVKPLEGLKDATKDLNHIDRSDIYYQLLLSYIKQTDVDKALGLWTQMQEEDIAPNDQFLNRLGTFLQEKGIEVPFVVPDVLVPEEDETDRSKHGIQKKSSVQLFRQAMKSGKLNEAIKIKEYSKEPVTSSDMSMLIEGLLQSNDVPKATELVMEMLNKSTHPYPRVFRFLLNKIANNGDVETLTVMQSKLSTDMKKLLSFDNRICHANLVAGKAEEYLNIIENEIDVAEDKELQAIAEKFPRGGAHGILEKYPHLTEKFEDIAIKFVKRGVLAPMNVLWAHHFILGSKNKAESLWTEYLQNSPRLMFQRVVHHARDTQDDNVVRKLIELLGSSKVTEGAIGNAYSCLLDILVSKGSNEEVITTFENALKEISLDYINRTAVLRVKNVYIKLGKPFNYTIPAKLKNKSNASTSSTSTDEEFESTSRSSK